MKHNHHMKLNTFYRFIYFSILLLLLTFFNNVTFAQGTASALYTDFGGFWYSSTSSNNTIMPNRSHNLLAFTWNGVTYSTGANDAKLTANNVTFTPTNYYAFPMDDINWPATPNSTATFVGLGSMEDGSPLIAAYSRNTPIVASDILTDGIHGLDIGSCITNLPAQTTDRYGT